MRKIYIALLSLFTLFFWSTKSTAQISTYVFLASNGTYTENADPARVILGSITSDDQVFNNSTTGAAAPVTGTGFPIGFNFTYNGIVYDRFAVSNNGWMVLGTSATPFQIGGSGNYTPLSLLGPVGYVSAIGGLARDLQGQAGSELSYQTLGTGTSHYLLIQFKGYRRFNQTGQIYNFQIRLNETSNSVQVIYGAFTESTATDGAVQVGLRGATSADFNNRTGFWAVSTAGGTNAATMTLTNVAGATPASGLTYTWLTPPPCVTPPGGGTTTGPAGALCPGINFTLAVTGSSFGTGLTYQWESSPDNLIWTPVAGGTGLTLSTSVTANTYFRRKITCSAIDGYSTSFLVTVSGAATVPFTETFATYATVFPPACWTMNNATYMGGFAPSAYNIGAGSARFQFFLAPNGAFLDLTTSVFTAVPANYRLTFDHSYATYTGENDQLQILYSTDGGTTFTSLIIYNGGSAGPLNTAGTTTTQLVAPTAAQWASKSIALPTGTNKLMFRGISAFGNNLFLDNITVEPTPSCLPPTGLITTAIGPTTATLSWTASVTAPSNGYQWEVRSSGAAGSGPVGLAASGVTAAGVTTANVIGLTGNTTYNYYVRSDCGASNFSSWATPYTFTTPCVALTVPFIETFSTYATTFPPACWTRNNALYLTGQAPSAYGIGLGSAKFDFYGAAAGVNLDLTSPIFTPVTASYSLVFDHAYATFFGENDQLVIQYSTNGGASYTNLITYNGGTGGPLNTAGAVLPAFSPTAAQWATKIVPLPAGTNRLLFRGVSAFGNNLFLDNITISSCLAPTGLGLTAISPTTATLSWTASTSAPSNGYQWEVRTSGVGGSGAVGLVASGTTPAGVTTANVAGLTAFTAYTYYVRSDCGGTDFSIWASYAFTTPCNPIGIPFTETFATYATTFPPTCWTRNDATYLIGQAPSANGIGLGSAKFDFYDAADGTNLNLISPVFTATPAGWGLIFDHAYATFAGEVDSLRIQYSTNAGATYTNLISYAGGGGGPLNTAGAVLPAFTPTAGQWSNKAIPLPAGTNRLLFKGVSNFGNNLYLDNIALVSCLPPTNVVALGVSPTAIRVSFTSTGGAFVVEYGAPGFVPGTTNAAGVGGTVILTPSSPVTISPLTPNTTYDVYVRRICTPGVDYSINVKATATTLCPATGIPYLQNFETSVPLVGFPTCTSMEDVNGNSGPTPNGGGGRWITENIAQTYVSPTRSMWYIYDLGNASRGGDDWFYLQGLNLTGGTTYRVKAFYKGSDAPTWVEKFEIKYGTLAYSGSMTNLIYSTTTSTAVADPFDSLIADFTPAATGVYYIGFHGISDPDQAFLFIDDISVKVAPKVDVGITGITLPTLTCPTSGVFVQATIKNYNTTVQNFAVYPVTVTATITGAGTGTLTALLNTGTLAPGASMGIYLSPAFNFTNGGIYNITTTTSSPDDPETANDAFTTSVNVNPNPATPVITPASTQLCLGGQVQLNTQFAPSPPPVTLPPVSSGAISVVVPDGIASGIITSLAVNTVPVGATVTGVSVTMNMTHTFISDMIINLVAPNGSILNLINQRGGAGDNLTNTVITSDPTAASLATGAPPYTGTFAPDATNGVGPTAYPSNVTLFQALLSQGNGTWTLAMRDVFGLDVGTLTSWSITITYQILTPVVTWTPVTGLFTNATATTAYTAGTNAFSVYSKPATTGTFIYTATATTTAGCTASGTATVTVNPNPVVTVGSIPDTVCISDPLIALVGNPVGGTWSGIGVSGNNFIPPATAVGTYTLTYNYTNAFGCPGSATKKIAVKDCPERIIELSDNALFLYPNPNNGQFNIRINSVLYNYLTMKVYANNGVLVRTQQLSGLAYGRVVPIDMTNLPGGVYMVKFYYDGGVRTSEKTFKVVIGNP